MSRKSLPAPVLVLGAGCAGLAAALRLLSAGLPVVVVEARERPGGLAGAAGSVGANLFEHGPHIFHASDPEVLAEVQALAGGELRPVSRTIKIRFAGGWFDYPLTLADVAGKLPPATLARAGASLVLRSLQGLVARSGAPTSETVLRRAYGDVLYELFFESYIERVWGRPASAFSPAFARERIPRLGALAAAQKLLARRRAEKTEGFVETVAGPLYTTRAGFSLITDRMAQAVRERGGELRLGCAVERLELSGGRLARAATSTGVLPCSGAISTLPLDEAARMVFPALPAPALEAAGRLSWRGTVFLALHVRRPRVLPAAIAYFREHVFNRVSDLSQLGREIRPAGTTVLVAEINADPSEPLWADDAGLLERALRDLEREGLLSPAELLESKAFRVRRAYPVYALGFEADRAAALRALEGLGNVEAAGRQGRFAYVNTHVAMKMGYEAADRLAGRLA